MGDAAAAAALTATRTLIASGEVAPLPITVLLVQLKRSAPGAPSQLHALPVGVAAKVTPVGRRSSTLYTPTLGCGPMLRTRSV